MTSHVADIKDIRTGLIGRRGRRLLAAAALVAAAGMLAGGPGGREKLQFSDARMIIEFNDTDQDVGMQLFVDGDPWKVLKAFDPDGNKVLQIRGVTSLNEQGLTELFFESSEPTLTKVPLKEFLKRFPEGVYELEGITTDGREIEGEATFTHVIPEGPVLISPKKGSDQDPDNTVVAWLPVPDPKDSAIQSYQVIVTELLDVLPKRTFSVFVPGSTTSVTVPPEFLQDDAEYEFEVLAIEEGGNQTLSSSSFSTKR